MVADSETFSCGYSILLPLAVLAVTQPTERWYSMREHMMWKPKMVGMELYLPHVAPVTYLMLGYCVTVDEIA